MDVFVAYLDPQMGKVLGAYATKTEAEAAIGRMHMGGEYNYDGSPTPEVLKFEMDASAAHECDEDLQARLKRYAQAERDEWRKAATRAQQAYAEAGAEITHLRKKLAESDQEWQTATDVRVRIVAERDSLKAKVAELEGLFDGNDFTYGGYRYTCERA